MRLTLVPLLALAFACNKGAETTAAPEAAAEDAGAAPATSEAMSLEESITSALNPEAGACNDFYEYACGGWLESTELPGDKTRWTKSFSVIHERNQELLKTIMEEAISNPGDDANLQKIGAVYGSCLDMETIDAVGTAPLEPWLAKVNSIDSLESLMKVHGELQLVNIAGPIGGGVYGDFKTPDMNILHVGQAGLGLPDRDYYLELDDKEQALLNDYEAHIARMLGIAKASETPAEDAAKIVAFETKLAEIHVPRDELRDPTATYNRIEREGLQKLIPDLPLDPFFAGLGYEGITTINVEAPVYFEKLNALLKATELDTLKAWLTWHTVDGFSTNLTTELDEANFDFYSAKLRGQKEQEPRWKRCVNTTSGYLGDAIGQAYVDRAFEGDSKDIALTMIIEIEHAFEAGLPALAWMDDKTREGAVEKVGTLANKIGYPDAWKDYSTMDLKDGEHFNNVVAGRTWSSQFELNKVGNKVDPNEWFMAPSDVNAYYNPLANEMAFPAGILQPPFFDKDFPMSMNFGAIGMVMGHELTHGFDDSGRKFDPQGKMEEWWAPEASEKFEAAASCVEEQYNAVEALPGMNINGKLTMGENIADIGGIKETHAAYLRWLETNGAEPEIGGFTGEQQLFLAFAQGWCTLATDELIKERLTTDSHSPPKARVNEPLKNLPAFGKAFGCEVGDPMMPEDVCEIW